MPEITAPMDIEKRSFEIISETLGSRVLDPENEAVIKRVIHTTADFDYAERTEEDSHLKIAKLTAIFRVADGICRSYRTKVRNIKLNTKNDELLITVDADEEITLEKGFFGRKASLFEEVFGIKPVLKQKKHTV